MYVLFCVCFYACNVPSHPSSFKLCTNIHMIINFSFYSCFYILILHLLRRKIAFVANVICYTKTDGKSSFLYLVSCMDDQDMPVVEKATHLGVVRGTTIDKTEKRQYHRI